MKWSVNIVDGDILDSRDTYICHQVNCVGVMGAGLAKQIRCWYPNVYDKYKVLCEKHSKNPRELLGGIQVIKIGKNQFCVNMFAQENYGKNGVYTEEEAFEQCCKILKKYVEEHKGTIAMPYKIGCGYGGGNWRSIVNIIAKTLGDTQLTVYRM